MDYFYDGQIRRYLTQFIRVMSNFSYKDAKGQLVQVPVRYGDMNRQVAQILNKNSENVMPSAPFIACYIKEIKFDRARMQDPTFISKVNIRESLSDGQGGFINQQDGNYTVERVMPSPFEITFNADIWTSNTDQKLQLWEQMIVLFNPSLEIQTTDNYIDWTSLSLLELVDQVWSSRSIPQGIEQDIDILTLVFKSPIWITPPAKVKKLGIVTKIIGDIFVMTDLAEKYDPINGILDIDVGVTERVSITPGQFDLLVLNNTASLIKQNRENELGNWHSILDLYPGKFKAGLSQLRLTKPDGGEIIARVSLDPLDDTKLALNIDPDTIPANDTIAGRTTVDAIIDPGTFNPKSSITSGTRYLILENINPDWQLPGYDGPTAWKNSDGSDFVAHANDIIEWDGTNWSIVFNSTTTATLTYITNTYTGIQYKWGDGHWSKSFEGVYDNSAWRLVL
jgi:hypothetical protein